MKVRIISLLLAAALILSTAGCGEKQKTSAETKEKSAAGNEAVQTTAAQTGAAENTTAQTAETQETPAQTTQPAQTTGTRLPADVSLQFAEAGEPAGTTAPPAGNGTPLFELHTDEFSLVITGLTEGTGHPFFGDSHDLHYIFENKTQKTLSMSWDLISVCGWVLPMAVLEPVEPGAALTSVFGIFKVFLDNFGVKSPDEVRFRLSVRDDGDENAEPYYDQYVAFYPTGKTAAEIEPGVHPLAEEGIVLAETDEFRFILIPKQMEEGISTHFLVLLTNKTDHEMRFRWSEVEANGYSVAEYVPDDEYYTNGTILPPHASQVEYLEVVIGALLHLGSPTVEQLAFRLDVFDHPLAGEETNRYSETLSLYPTGKAPEDVSVPAVPEKPGQKVLFDNGDVKLVVLDEFEVGCGVRYLTVYAENRSGKDVIVSLHDITVDETENRLDETLLLPAGKNSLLLCLVDPVFLPEETERGPEEIRFLMDVRLADGTVLLQDEECTVQFSEVFQEESLQEEEEEGVIRYDSAP